MAKLPLPTGPITTALVGGTPALLALVRTIANSSPAGMLAFRAYELALHNVQSTAENQAQLIEQRLRVLESAAEDVVNQTGNIFRLSTDVPRAIAATGVVGTTSTIARGDHTHAGVRSITTTSPVGGAVTFDGAVTQAGSTFTFTAGGGSIYELPIVGPRISIRGTTFLAISKQVVIQGGHTASTFLSFLWEAGNVGVDALWRLFDRKNGQTILSGSRAAPFAETLEIVTDPGANLPAAPAWVALEVCFSGVGSGGEIGLTSGPGTLVLAG